MFGRSCSYTVCPINRKGNQICRIRYDFESFQIAGPETGITRSTATTIAAGDGGAIGDCIEDAFSISSPSGPGSPVICGTNSGYHSKYTVFENRPKSRIQYCERSELHSHFKWTNVNFKCKKFSFLATFENLKFVKECYQIGHFK